MLHHACPRCGKPMAYTGGKFKLQCKNCGYNRQLGRESDQVDNHPLKAGVSLKGFARGLGEGLSSYQCGNCGVILARSAEAAPAYCPICRGAGDAFEASQHHAKVIFPKGVIPFTISEQQARDIIRGIFSQPYTRYFLPDELLRLCDAGEIQPVYVPIFRYDALTRSTWRVESGLPTSDGEGGVQLIFEPTAGYYEHFFEDFDVPIVAAIPEFGGVYDYDLGTVVEYDSRFLQGFNTELYQFDEIETFQMADQMMSGVIRDAVQARVIGEQTRQLEIKSEKFALAFQHILVPLWIGVFHYEGETYTYLVNGQTGTCSGSNPLAARKIVLATAGFALMVILLGLLVG